MRPGVEPGWESDFAYRLTGAQAAQANHAVGVALQHSSGLR